MIVERMFLLGTLLLIGLTSAQKVISVTPCSIDKNNLQIDCIYEQAAGSPEARCNYTLGDKTVATSNPDEPTDPDYKSQANVTIVGRNCQLRFNNLSEGQHNFTCNIKEKETSSKRAVVEKKNLLPCSAWSTSLQRCTGALLGLSALSILLQISGLL